MGGLPGTFSFDDFRHTAGHVIELEYAHVLSVIFVLICVFRCKLKDGKWFATAVTEDQIRRSQMVETGLLTAKEAISMTREQGKNADLEKQQEQSSCSKVPRHFHGNQFSTPSSTTRTTLITAPAPAKKSRVDSVDSLESVDGASKVLDMEMLDVALEAAIVEAQWAHTKSQWRKWADGVNRSEQLGKVMLLLLLLYY